VSVSDTGVCIAPEDQEAVFEEFRQVGTAAKKGEGTGLGLTLSEVRGAPRRKDLGHEPARRALDVYVHDIGASWTSGICSDRVPLMGPPASHTPQDDRARLNEAGQIYRPRDQGSNSQSITARGS